MVGSRAVRNQWRGPLLSFRAGGADCFLKASSMTDSSLNPGLNAVEFHTCDADSFLKALHSTLLRKKRAVFEQRLSPSVFVVVALLSLSFAGSAEIINACACVIDSKCVGLHGRVWCVGVL